MIDRGVMAALIILLILPTVSLAQSAVGEQPADQADEDSSTVHPSGSLLFLPASRFLTSTTLTFSMHHKENANRFLGYETYRASRSECAFQGAGMGMTLGMAAGAFGMMTGAWDEKETWYIAGAMTVLGTLYGGLIKADDPKWNLRIRWDPDR